MLLPVNEYIILNIKLDVECFYAPAAVLVEQAVCVPCAAQKRQLPLSI